MPRKKKIDLQGLTPEQARLLLIANERLISKKLVQENRPLTWHEQKILREIAQSGTEKEAPEGWANKITDLAKVLGIHRNTIYNYITLPDFPKRREGLGYNVFEVRKYFQQKGVLPENEIYSNEAYRKKLEAESKKEQARALILEARAKKELGELIEVDKAVEVLTDIFSDFQVRLRSLPQIIARLSAGRQEQEIEKITTSLIDDFLHILVTQDIKKKFQS